MPGTKQFAYVSYTLTDCLVARYDIVANTYSAPQYLYSGQSVEVEPEADNDELRGYGVKTALLSVIVGGKITVGAGGIDFNALQEMSGSSNATSGSAPSQFRHTTFSAGGSGLPYFGLVGLAATDDGGYLMIGLPCCKLSTFPKITADGKENKFNMSETSGAFIPISGTAMYTKGLQSTSSWVAPITGTQFKALFT